MAENEQSLQHLPASQDFRKVYLIGAVRSFQNAAENAEIDGLTIVADVFIKRAEELITENNVTPEELRG